MSTVLIRAAKPRDVRKIEELMSGYVDRRILLGKERVVLYESIQEFVVAERGNEIVGCGALHVMWKNLAEVRTLAVSPTVLGTGVGHRILEALIERARALEISRLVCLTFETDFFAKHGFTEIRDDVLSEKIVAQMVRSPDGGIAEFLDLPHVRPNTLGNTRMLLKLPTVH